MKRKWLVFTIVLFSFIWTIQAREIAISEAIDFAMKWIKLENEIRFKSSKPEELQFGQIRELTYEGINVGLDFPHFCGHTEKFDIISSLEVCYGRTERS